MILRQTRSRADQEAHAPFYVQCEALERSLQSELPNERVFMGVINRELDKVNKHVISCLKVLESASPASISELVCCSTECGSLSTFIRCNRDELREIAKKFHKKVRSATERCTCVSMQMVEAAPFCTSLLERTLNLQTTLEKWALQRHGGDCNLCRLLTCAYEASAGLSGNESPRIRGTPMAPDAPRMPSLLSSRRQAWGIRRASTRPPRARGHTNYPLVEVAPPAVEERSQTMGPLFIHSQAVYLDLS